MKERKKVLSKAVDIRRNPIEECSGYRSNSPLSLYSAVEILVIFTWKVDARVWEVHTF